MAQINPEWLSSEIGKEIISQVSNYPDSLIAASKLRAKYPQIETELIRQAIGQAVLKTKLKIELPDHFLLTEDGLQQGTRPQVAKYRAAFIAKNFGQQNVVDLTCGLGFDSYFLSEAGHNVSAVEKDPDVYLIAKNNLPDLKVVNQNAEQYEIPSETQIVFVDPARRDPSAAKSAFGQAKRIMNPDDWSPSWSFVKALAEKFQVIAKVAPGFSVDLIDDWDAYWISADGDLVETMVVSGGSGRQIAVLLEGQSATEIAGGQQTKVAEIGKYLIVPNPALIRASALNYLAEQLNAGLVNEHIAWLTSNDEAATEFKNSAAKVLQITEVTKFNEKQLATRISEIKPGALTIMTRGVNLDPELLRKKISKKPVKGGQELVLAIYRDDQGPIALICNRLPKVG